jgi:hypothetical protein
MNKIITRTRTITIKAFIIKDFRESAQYRNYLSERDYAAIIVVK